MLVRLQKCRGKSLMTTMLEGTASHRIVCNRSWPFDAAIKGLTISALAIAGSCSRLPDVRTPEGQFLQTVKRLADSGSLTDPGEVARLLGTEFTVEHKSFNTQPVDCANQLHSNRTFEAYRHTPVGSFWYKPILKP